VEEDMGMAAVATVEAGKKCYILWPVVSKEPPWMDSGIISIPI